MPSPQLVEQQHGIFSYLQVINWRERGIHAGFGDRTLDTRSSDLLWRQFSSKKLLLLNQVHGSEIVDLTGEDVDADSLERDKPLADGWIADLSSPGLSGYALGIETADCTPVLLLSPENNLVALCHCGWRSAVAGLLTKTLQRMAAKVSIHSIEIAIGPAASVKAYEVGIEVVERIESAWRVFGADTPCDGVEQRASKYFADIPALLVAQATSLGVSPSNILQAKQCTITNSCYFSYRRDPLQVGRQISFIECS